MTISRSTAIALKTLDAVKDLVAICEQALDNPSEFQKQLIKRKLKTISSNLPQVSRKLVDTAEKKLKHLITDTNLDQSERE